MKKQLSPWMLRVLTPQGETAGAGFAVAPKGLIVTCAHVVNKALGRSLGAVRLPAGEVAVHFLTGGKDRAATVIAWSPMSERDVAVLRLDGELPDGVEPIFFGSADRTRGRPLSTFGFPDASPVEGLSGKCEVVGETTVNGFPALQLRSSEVTRGFSGAPVWDETLGVAAGMVIRVAEPDRQGRLGETTLLVPAESIREICPELRLPEGSPYRGLDVFEREHVHLYFGREREAGELLKALNEQDAVLLVGVSGSGKSSLVRAGLEKALSDSPVPGLSRRQRVLALPGSAPLLNLVLALSEHLNVEIVTDAFALPADALSDEHRGETAERLRRRSPRELARSLQKCAPRGGLLLILDQFERLYTDCTDEATQRHFLDAVLSAASDRVRLLFALRADYYAPALEHPGMERIVQSGGQITLGRMNEDGLRDAIEKPAHALGRTFEPGLVKRLIADVRGQAGDLPLLQFALIELWERDQQKGVLTLETYESLGYRVPGGRSFPGVQGAIAQRAEAIWEELNDDERRAARQIFLSLARSGIDEGEKESEDVSRRAWISEWDQVTQSLAEKLLTARLLTSGKDPLTNQPTVEVAHEVLLRAWPRLQRWIREYRPLLVWRDAELEPFLRRWLESGRDEFLLPESMLPEAQKWLAKYPEELGERVGEFIQTSAEAEARERAARERTRRRLLQVALAAAFIFLMLAGVAFWQASVARRQRDVARARQWAAVGQDAFNRLRPKRGPFIALALGVESMRLEPSLQANQLLHSGLILAPEVARMLHDGNVETVAFSPDGRYVVSGGDDGTARVWETATGREVARMTHENWVSAVAFSPDGRYVVSGGCDRQENYTCIEGTVRVWEALTGREVARMTHENWVSAVAFSPDGRYVVSGGCDKTNENDFCIEGTVRVWEALTGREVARMRHGDVVPTVAFSPDGRYVVSGGCDDAENFICIEGEGTVRVWETLTGREVARMRHGDLVSTVAFSPDGRYVVSGSGDGTARVWEAETGREVARMTHDGSVAAVAFSADGRYVVSGSGDGTARVWEAKTGREVARMSHENWVNAVAFSPDGRYVVSGSGDGTARVWEAQTGREVARMTHEGGVTAVAFSPDGRYVVSGSNDNTARAWEAAAGREIARMTHDWYVTAVAFSPDGRYVVSGSWDGTARVWDVVSGREVARMTHDDGWTLVVTFSPDGRYVLSGSYDQTARVWETLTGREVARMRHGDVVSTVAFSPDGRYVVSGSGDGTARVWEAKTGREVARMTHDGSVAAVAFSADGRYVVSGSGDGTARVWEAKTGREVARMTHEDDVTAVAFSADGRFVVSGSRDRTVRVWEALTGREVARMTHEDDVTAVAFSSDGRYAVSGSGDGTARVWGAATGDEVARMTHEDYVTAVAFNPDGRYVVSGSGDGTARVWEAATGREVARMTHDVVVDVVASSPDGRYGSVGSGDVNAVAFSPDGRYVLSGSDDNTTRVWLWRPEDLLAEACRRLPRNLTLDEWQQYIGDDVPYHATCPEKPVPEDTLQSLAQQESEVQQKLEARRVLRMQKRLFAAGEVLLVGLALLLGWLGWKRRGVLQAHWWGAAFMPGAMALLAGIDAWEAWRAPISDVIGFALLTFLMVVSVALTWPRAREGRRWIRLLARPVVFILYSICGSVLFWLFLFSGTSTVRDLPLSWPQFANLWAFWLLIALWLLLLGWTLAPWLQMFWQAGVWVWWRARRK